MSKRVLVLGIGAAQRDLLVACRERGYEVCACSNSEAGPGHSLADRFEMIDIADVTAVETWAEQLGVAWVYSTGSDLAMPTACAVSERLGLPTLVSSWTAALCNAKDRLRAHLGPSHEGNLEYIVATSGADLEFSRYPAIVKPSDSQGQRGVRKVGTREELVAHFEHARSFSRAGKVIVEQFIDGPEISVNTYSVDGQLTFCLISDRVSWPQFPGGIIHEHRLPSEHERQPAHARIVSLVRRTLEVLAIRNGPAYFQIKLQQGMPYLIEITPRLDGCHLWRLIREYCGANLLEAVLDQLDGLSPEAWPILPGTARPRLKLEFLCEEPGRPFDRTRYAVDHPRFLQWFYEQGETVRRLNGFYEKGGYHIGAW
jgi:biotin carboxylase